MIVWCVFIKTIFECSNRLTSLNISNNYVYGGTKFEDREKILADFKNGNIRVLITNPIPEEFSMDPAYINAEIDKALVEMEKDGVKGKEETPYLLAKIVELTKGKSLEANIHLILNNAKLGAKIASEYVKLK